MTDIDLKQYRRIYLTLSDNKDGRVNLRATYARPPHGAYMVVLMSAGMMASPVVDVMLLSTQPSPIIRTVEVVDRALLAIALGLRTLTVACPGATVRQPIAANPVAALPAGYAVHNAWVTKKDEIALRITGPALALGASNTLSLAIARIG